MVHRQRVSPALGLIFSFNFLNGLRICLVLLMICLVLLIIYYDAYSQRPYIIERKHSYTLPM